MAASPWSVVEGQHGEIGLVCHVGDHNATHVGGHVEPEDDRGFGECSGGDFDPSVVELFTSGEIHHDDVVDLLLGGNRNRYDGGGVGPRERRWQI